MLAIVACALTAFAEPTVAWDETLMPLTLTDGIAIEFLLPYTVHLVGGADPEADARLSVVVCENGSCFESQLQAEEGDRFLRYGIDPSQYHLGKNRFTFVLLLTDNGISTRSRLRMPVTVFP